MTPRTLPPAEPADKVAAPAAAALPPEMEDFV
jgi:hypothetical protein